MFDTQRISNLNPIERFQYYIEEREAIRIRKENDSSWPWSEDPIFQKFKFTCVHRENDRTTRWIADNWRWPHREDPDLWFALVIARRTLNWPASMDALGYPVPWNPIIFIGRMLTRVHAGKKCFDTAYQLLVQGKKGDKAKMMVKYILDPLWNAREEIRPRQDDTLRSFFDRLSAFKYMGLFYTGQVIADLKYVQLTTASDWQTFAVPGPGSERGLNRLLGRDKNSLWRGQEWLKELEKLHANFFSLMHAQDMQNCLCEFDKYERARLNEGRVRPYKPTIL